MKIEECARLPDGSGFAVVSMDLPKDHWLLADHENILPMPMRIGTNNLERTKLTEEILSAAKYAVRSATRNGKDNDFDPDALIRNMVIGMLGYYTSDGLSSLD